MNHPIYQSNLSQNKVLLNKNQAITWVNEVFEWLFCVNYDCSNYEHFLAKESDLKATLQALLEQVNWNQADAENLVQVFFEKLVTIKCQLDDDLNAVFNFDPAAKSREEVLITYPGFYAISVYRIAHELWEQKVPILPRLLSEHVHSKTGIDIHPGAKIGNRFFVDHGTGIVVGETSEIGDDVKIYQGVTLGALSVVKEEAEVKRHPSIGNGVVIYANATILGGRTFIGDNSVIGGNVWITNTIPANSLVYHKSEISIKTKAAFPEPLNFVI